MSKKSYLDCRRTFQLGSVFRQVKLLKVSSPILILLVMVLSSIGGQLLIARAADTCSESICYVRAGYVAHGDPDTYDFVEGTFTLPQSGDIIIPSGTTSTKFSIGVGLGGDNHFNSPNWLSAQVDIQVTNGQVNLIPVWSLADGATKAGQGSGGGYFLTKQMNVKLGDTIKVSVELDNTASPPKVTFAMRDTTSHKSDKFTMPNTTFPDPLVSNSLPDGKVAGCFVFFSNTDKYPNFAHPKQVNFTSCNVGDAAVDANPIDPDPAVSFGYKAQGLSNSASLTIPDSKGGFVISWNG